MVVMHDGPFDHEHLIDEDSKAFAASIWAQEHVNFTTVGIDIGSSTTHLIFARLLLQRDSEGLSSRFEVTKRKILFESPIIFTPFHANGFIDASALESFFVAQYSAAGLRRDDVDTGAVILTGEAIRKHNARAIDELFAEQGGKFVCATAGHHLEAMLAAKGSGAVAFSRANKNCVLHVDIGGGTTKLALIDHGEILDVAAFAAGGRLVAQDAAGDWTRIDDAARSVAADLGVVLEPGALREPALRERITARLAAVIMDQITGAQLDRLGQELLLTEPLAWSKAPDAISFSGGVSEYIFGRETRSFADVAQSLGSALKVQMARRLTVRIIDPGQGIRATVLGASQFTVQVSGKTIYVSGPECINIHNIPVVPLDVRLPSDADAWRDAAVAARQKLDLADNAGLAFAFSWRWSPDYALLHACAKGIAASCGAPEFLALVIDGDVGRSLGLILHSELFFAAPLVSIDGLKLQAHDYVDIGSLVDPPGVIPVIIKSLII